MRIVTAFLLLLLLQSAAHGDDWPRWMGPQRDNVWREEGILQEFPEGGPKVVWRSPVAGGYAGPAVAHGKVYVTDYVTSDNVKVDNFDRNVFSGTERVLCLDETTGKQIWKHEYPVKYDISYPAGPRCTPNVHEGRVYTLGAVGNLLCLDAESGDVIWSKNLPVEYNAKNPLWGYAAHPVIDGDKLITIAGGEGSHLVAFNKNTGEEIWRALSTPEQGYSPPTIIEAAGVRQMVHFHPRAVVSVDPETGKLYWSLPYEASNGSAIMTPLRSGDLLYTGGFSNKNILIRLSNDKPAAETVWRDQFKAGLSPVNVQPFLEDEVLYGFDQDGYLYAVDLAKGTRLWQSGEPLKAERRPPGSGTAFIVRHQDRCWMFTEQGELVIARLSREGYEEIDRAKVIEPSNVAFGRDVVWCPPAWANRRVYIRNDNECICVDLSADQ